MVGRDQAERRADRIRLAAGGRRLRGAVRAGRSLAHTCPEGPKGFQQPPYTTSTEPLAYIRTETPADRQQRVTDLFEKISFYDNRVLTASAQKRDDGKYDVTLKLHAEKRYADGDGKETAGTMDDWIEVGVFANAPLGKERDQKVLYLQRHHVTEANPSITVTVDGKPDEAGFDPYNKLIDRVSSDNRRKVTL